MRKCKFILLATLSVVALRSVAHTIQLGDERAPRACAVIRESRETNLLFWRHEKQDLYFVDGTRTVFVVVLPTKELPNNQADGMLTDCARLSFSSTNRQAPLDGNSAEDAFMRTMNQCLQSRRAGYDVSGAFFRRSDISCPPSSRPASN